jgi:hypothetical protein
VRGKRRGGEEPPRFEVEDRIHGWGRWFAFHMLAIIC